MSALVKLYIAESSSQAHGARLKKTIALQPINLHDKLPALRAEKTGTPDADPDKSAGRISVEAKLRAVVTEPLRPPLPPGERAGVRVDRSAATSLCGSPPHPIPLPRKPIEGS